MSEKKYRVIAEKTNSFRYLITKFNEEGWADAKKNAPIPYDLVLVKTDTDKKITAWWNEQSWDGFRLKDKDNVLEWKRLKYEQRG